MTVGRRLLAGFGVSALTLAVIAAVSYRNADLLITNERAIANTQQVRSGLADLLSELKDAETGQRGYIITGDEVYLQPYTTGLDAIERTLTNLRTLAAANSRLQHWLAAMAPVIERKLSELKDTISLRRSEGFEPAARLVRTDAGKEAMGQIRRLVLDADKEEQRLLQERSAESQASADSAVTIIVFGGLIGTSIVLAIGWFISRSLSTQIGGAVGQVQTSSAELQAAANQQASGAKEQVSAMTKISTTITELLATSRQIAESAQRVSQIAEQTASAARAGHGTVDVTQESISGIRRQVDQIVSHMLELGRKSQQIGAVLDIVSELAEQTNILAINATIEAAGAGDAGNRFAVVAEEIRKLADRVAGSTKEVRSLIDEVRSAVNTTVMATETGSKAVDAGTRQLGDLASSFKQIAALVATTTDAAREIELSTRQQSSAVEQVNSAIANMAQTSVETEASAGQTLQTVSEMAVLSMNLSRIIRPQFAG